MMTTSQLLKLPPFSALLVLVNQSLGLRLNPNHIRLKSFTPLEGLRTQATLEAITSEDGATQRVYEGTLTFYYNRLDLSEVFGEDYQVDLPLPATLTDILGLITTHTGIVFDERDFELTVAKTKPHVLRAKEESLRWVGKVNLYLTHASDDIPLDTVILTDELNGLTLPRIELDTLIVTTELSGLTPPDIPAVV